MESEHTIPLNVVIMALEDLLCFRCPGHVNMLRKLVGTDGVKLHQENYLSAILRFIIFCKCMAKN